MRASMGGAHKLRLLTVTVLTGLIGSCVDSSEPNAPSTSSGKTAAETAQQAPPSRGIDAEFTRLAREIPGFGGMYYDRAGKLNVYATKSLATARGVDVTGRLRALGGTAVQRGLRGGAVTMREAKYDYLQLQGWKSRLGKIFTVKGVVYTDIDEEANRIGVALTPGASQAAAEKVLKAAKVPLEAVSFRRMPAIRQLQTIQERVRPVPGAVQIVFPAPSEGPNLFFLCTLGFNARLPGQPGRNFFVTASHCSDIQGGNQSTPYYQPAPKINPATDRVAIEFRDPQYGNPGGQCFEGFRCRLADALLARYETTVGVGLGKIARTTFGLQRIGSLIIDPANPRWNVIGEFGFPFLGETAHKVGRTTGWTRGPVVATCVDVEASGTGFIELCQDIVRAGVNGGDSGSGVFERASASSSDVFLIGILWGGGTDSDGSTVFVQSPMENIEFELGDLTTAAP